MAMSLIERGYAKYEAVIEQTLFDYDLLHKWESDIPYLQAGFSKMENMADLIKYLKATNLKRQEAKRREDFFASSENNEDLMMGQIFGDYKHTWAGMKNLGIGLAIILRYQGSNQIEVAENEVTAEDVEWADKHETTVGKRLLVSIRPQPYQKPYMTRTYMNDLVKTVSYTDLDQIIGVRNPWPQNAHK